MSRQSLLALVAHPDDESFGLGALLDGAARAGWRTGVLCATHGEASTLHGVAGDLRTIRERELHSAARQLGVDWVRLLDHADGALGDSRRLLTDDVAAAVSAFAPDLLLTFDPNGITGHPDHVVMSQVAADVAADTRLPILAWGLPEAVVRALTDEGFGGFQAQPDDDRTLVVTVDRTAQRWAVAEHPSQAVPGSPLWRRLELLGDLEQVRWLGSAVTDVPWEVPAGATCLAGSTSRVATPAAGAP